MDRNLSREKESKSQGMPRFILLWNTHSSLKALPWLSKPNCLGVLNRFIEHDLTNDKLIFCFNILHINILFCSHRLYTRGGLCGHLLGMVLACPCCLARTLMAFWTRMRASIPSSRETETNPGLNPSRSSSPQNEIRVQVPVVRQQTMHTVGSRALLVPTT